MIIGMPTLLFLLTTICGAATVYFSFILFHKYKQPFLLSYLLYLVFIFIFNIYSFWGQYFWESVLQFETNVNFRVNLWKMFIPFLSLPLLMLSSFMYIKTCREIVKKKTSLRFTLFYFIVQFFCFIILGILFNKQKVFSGIVEFEAGAFFFWLFIGFDMFWGLFAVYQIFRYRKSELMNERHYRLATGFAWLNLFVYCTFYLVFCITLFFPEFELVAIVFSFAADLPVLLFLFVFLGRNSLFYNVDLENNQREFEKFHISKREREIIEFIYNGKKNKEISSELNISLQTVKDHIYNIFQKTGVKNRVQLTNLFRDEQEKSVF